MKRRRRLLRNGMTGPEFVLWEQLRGKQLGGFKFRRQYSISSYIVDFYCVKARLVVEVDGDTHYTDDAIEHDIRRTEFIESLGLKVIRFTNIDVCSSLEGVILAISDELGIKNDDYDNIPNVISSNQDPNPNQDQDQDQDQDQTSPTPPSEGGA